MWQKDQFTGPYVQIAELTIFIIVNHDRQLSVENLTPGGIYSLDLCKDSRSPLSNLWWHHTSSSTIRKRLSWSGSWYCRTSMAVHIANSGRKAFVMRSIVCLQSYNLSLQINQALSEYCRSTTESGSTDSKKNIMWKFGMLLSTCSCVQSFNLSHSSKLLSV